MKLTELEPRWIAYSKDQIGISFLCPHCKTTRLGVRTDHAPAHDIPADPALSVDHHLVEHIWQMTGDNPSVNELEHGGFENVTLSPSVDAGGVGHWHGFITHGVVISCG